MNERSGTSVAQATLEADSDAPQAALGAERSAYALALIAELRLLVRTVANDPTKRLNALRLSYQLPGMASTEDLTFDKVLNRISAIERNREEHAALEQIGFLQAVRDALVAMTAPATGLTIAYTTLVTGGQRSADTESAYDLAGQAYGRLRSRALWHRTFVWLLTVAAIACTGAATWQATSAALGKSLLQNMDVLRSQQVALMAEKLKLETSLDRPMKDTELGGGTDGGQMLASEWFPLCDRHQNRLLIAKSVGLSDRLPADDNHNLLPLAASPAERDLCGRDAVLASNISTLHIEMRQYLTSWPGMVGGVLGTVARLLSNPAGNSDPCPPVKQAGDGREDKEGPPTCDLEFFIGPKLQVTTNYIMPLTFGFLGSLLYVLLDHFTKLRANTLNPKDLSLMPLRLILGLVIAACVSLLVSSYATPGQAAPGSAGGPPAVGSLVASLTLSASGLAFLAGFGAEAVFTLLQSLIERVFATQK